MVNNNDSLDLLIRFLVVIKDVIVGGVGGIVAYMFEYSRTKKDIQDYRWSNGAMVINLFIGSFMAYTLGSFIPIDTGGRDGLIGLIGVSSYAILGIIESRFAKIIVDRLLGGGK